MLVHMYSKNNYQGGKNMCEENRTDVIDTNETDERQDVLKNDTPSLKDDPPATDPGDASGKKSDDPPKNLADILYDNITSVIGGDNPNQFFCMQLPGTLLDISQYSYDVNKPKPAHVKANESKLADKLFDACFMSPSANGKHLNTQYKTALNMLTPKLNGMLFDAKNKLREVLMTPYPYNFEDGSSDVLTLEQVFYKLYGDYVAAKEAWGKKQLDQKELIHNKHKNDTGDTSQIENDEFLEWYGVVAESEELVVEEKLGKVLSVFSPGDMEIITGILESGTGGELAEARKALDNVGELDPNGGYVYPVSLYPTDWFTLLDTSFTPVDLLESPAALSQRLKTLIMQRSNITSNINQFLQIIPDEKEVKDLKDSYDTCESTYKKAFDDNVKQYAGTTVDMLKTLIDIVTPKNPKSPDDNKPDFTAVTDSMVSRIFGGISPEDAKNLLNGLGKAAQDCLDTQSKLVDSSAKAVDAAMKYFSADSKRESMKNMLEPLRQQLEDVNNEISELKQQIALSKVVQTDPTDKDGNVIPPDSSSVAPNSVPDRFTQIIIDTKMSSLQQQSSHESSASQSSTGVSFFFGGYSSNKSHQDAVDKEMQDNSSMEIQIGMSVAKVEIDREWFNPGVFDLTADMYNTSSEHISPDNQTSFHDSDPNNVKARMDAMNKCVFPCYPTAFVVAKDVTVKFVSQQAISSSFSQSVEDHSSKGGGFFIFGGSSSSASSSSNSSSSATSSSNSVTVRFTAPQILGYYLEAIAPDKSVSISSAETNSNNDFISIFEFINRFQQMLDEHNNKYNTNVLTAGRKE